MIEKRSSTHHDGARRWDIKRFSQAKKTQKEPARQKRGAEAASGCKAGVFDHAG